MPNEFNEQEYRRKLIEGGLSEADATDLAGSLRDVAAEGDLIVCMGAGDITKWAAGLADGIRAARAAK